MFLQLSVILFTGNGVSEDTSLGRHLPGQTQPLGRHPLRQTPLGRHPWIDTPTLGRTLPDGTHATGMHSCLSRYEGCHKFK